MRYTISDIELVHGEIILSKVKFSFLVIIPKLLWCFISIGICKILIERIKLFAYLPLIVTGILFIRMLVYVSTAEIYITNYRIIGKTRFLKTHRFNLPYDIITLTQFSQWSFGKLLHYGDVELCASDSKTFKIEYVVEPKKTVQFIQDLVNTANISSKETINQVN